MLKSGVVSIMWCLRCPDVDTSVSESLKSEIRENFLPQIKLCLTVFHTIVFEKMTANDVAQVWGWRFAQHDQLGKCLAPWKLSMLWSCGSDMLSIVSCVNPSVDLIWSQIFFILLLKICIWNGNFLSIPKISVYYVKRHLRLRIILPIRSFEI
jgi:hypothetical protein